MKCRVVKVKLISIAVVVGVLLISQHLYREEGFFDLCMEASGFLLLLIGGFGRVWASAYISGNKNKHLIVDGPYSIVRNPLYFFSFVSFMGAGLACESLAITAVLVALFFSTHWSTILSEERHLRNIFGEQFELYVKATPRFIPKPRLLMNPAIVSFTPTIFNRAVVDCSLIVGVFMLAHIIEWAHLHAHLPVVFTIP